METDMQAESDNSMRKIIVFATIVAGIIAANLMYRPGESLLSIAREAITNPVGSMVSEVKNVV